MSNKASCDKCRYYDRGYCKRFPPQYLGGSGQDYPWMKYYDWCGEFKITWAEEWKQILRQDDPPG